MARTAPLLLVLLVAPAGSAAAPAPGGSSTSVDGDEWVVNLTAALQLPDGTPVLLHAMWHVWQPWPVPYAGYEDRVNRVVLMVDDTHRENASVEFWLLRAAAPLQFNVTVRADGVAWSSAWTWTVMEGCTLNDVSGPLDARWGTLDGQLLQPLPTGGTGGIGFASKDGPGDDGQYECRGGYPL